MQNAPVNLNALTMNELVAMHNQLADSPVKKFRTKAAAVKKVRALQEEHAANAKLSTKEKKGYTLEEALKEEGKTKVEKDDSGEENKGVAKQRETLLSSLKLDRTIREVTTGEIFPNANQAWKSGMFPEVSGGMFDDITGKLYTAAKRGEKVQVEKKGFIFELVNV